VAREKKVTSTKHQTVLVQMNVRPSITKGSTPLGVVQADKLRQERQKEERHLGVQHIGQDTWR
jgi:hypothetical protein